MVRRQQVQNAAILAKDAVDKQLHLAPERLAQAVVEVREDDRVRIDLVERPHLQPLKREVADQRFGTRVGEQPSDLGLEHRRGRKRSAFGQRQELLVRSAANQEERQTRRQLHIRDRVHVAGRETSGRTLGSVEKLGTGENGGQRVANRRIEVTDAPGCPIEGERRLEIGIGDRTSIRLARQRRQDSPSRTEAPRSGWPAGR